MRQPFPRRFGRLRRIAAPSALALALALAVPGAASAGAPFKAVLHAPNHTPIENKGWKITVDVTKGSAKLSGDVNYDFLYQGTLVSHQPGHTFKSGVYTDTLTFPPAAVGKALTLRIVVKTKYGTVNLNWNVETKA